jgi:hypothetical protein
VFLEICSKFLNICFSPSKMYSNMGQRENLLYAPNVVALSLSLGYSQHLILDKDIFLTSDQGFYLFIYFSGCKVKGD